MQTGYKVIDIMTNKPVVADKDASLKEAANIMLQNNVNSLLITESDKAIGIITDEDLVRKVIAKGLDPRKTKIKDVMETELITISPEKDIYDAMKIMRDHNIRQLPVIEKNKLVGFLTAKDILKIQPELFDIYIERYELREEERKLSETKENDEDIFSEFFKKIGIKKSKK
ncbi:MAG: hypothetical protein KatS3mg002_0956 [Candidatus Woesearchaeota archaeon]|nr:MAG: hypothetical protein KatS3mg002_0956 [Candidatus Woesearchaeota archaeon]